MADVIPLFWQKTSQFKASCKDSKKLQDRAGLIKRQKSFQGLAMYGHEVFDVLTKASKVIRDTLFE
jgi:hypothetical protein